MGDYPEMLRYTNTRHGRCPFCFYRRDKRYNKIQDELSKGDQGQYGKYLVGYDCREKVWAEECERYQKAVAKVI